MGGAEVLAGITQERVVQAAKSAVELLSAPAPPTGRMKVLLDPSATGSRSPTNRSATAPRRTRCSGTAPT